MRNPAKANDLFGKLLDATIYDWIGLLVLTAVAVWLVYKLRSWYLGGEDPAACQHQLLSQLTELRGEGGLTDEEYRSIRGRIAQTIDDPRPPSGR